MAPRLGVDVDADLDTVWDLLVELDSWPRWGPTVREARLDDGTGRLHASARGAVRTVAGPWLPFRVEDWQEGDRRCSWSWRVAGLPATDHTVTADGPARCRVEMGVPWWGVGYLGVVRLGLTRIRTLAERRG